jgi:hypothetical protein
VHHTVRNRKSAILPERYYFVFIKLASFYVFQSDFFYIIDDVSLIEKIAIFWDVALCRSCVNRCFGGTYRFHVQGRKIRRLQLSAHTGTSIVNMEAIRSSETSVHTRSSQRHIPEDGIHHSHRCENLRSCVSLIVLKFVFRAGTRF